MVSNQGAQRLSIRHLSNGLRFDYGAAAFVVIWRPSDSRLEDMERGTADSRRGTAGAQGQARHANHGRRADNWLRGHFNFAMGQALECLRMDGRDSHAAFWGDRFRRRLLQDGETAQPRVDRQAKVAGTVVNRNRRLGGAVCLNQVFCERLFVERQHSFYQGHRGSQWHRFHRPNSLFDFHHHCLTGVFECSELN